MQRGLVALVLLILCLSSYGCKTVEPIIKTELLIPDFYECIKPTKPQYILYKDEDLESEHNFNAWINNHIKSSVYYDQSQSTMKCYENQINAVIEKKKELDQAKTEIKK